MRLGRLGWAALALCVCLSGMGTGRLLAQEGPQDGGQGGGQRGGRGGMFMMGANHTEGVVTAVSGSNITVRDEQGQVYTVETGPNTHIRKDREEAQLSDIHPGDTIVAAGHLDEQAKTLGAMFVVVLSPEQAARMKQMQESFGKTWTAGKVTAKNGLTLTVERPDKVSQTVTVNENTEFRRRGPDGEEDIAYPDIQVGDRVMARGALQNGSFVATTVGVMPPRQPGQRRFHGQGQQPPQDSQQPQGAPQF